MRVTVRIYKRHDLDLLAFYCADPNRFKKEFKETIKQYVNKKQIKNNWPAVESKSVYAMPTKISFHMILKEEDKDIRNYLQKITRGRRNNIMKHIYRNSLPVIDEPYFSESENQSFEIGTYKS